MNTHPFRRPAAFGAAFTIAILLTSGCTSADDNEKAAPATNAATSAPATLPAGTPAAETPAEPGAANSGAAKPASTEEVCSTITKATSEFVTATFASATGGQTAEVVKAYRSALTTLGTKLTATAPTASDPKLGAALRDAATAATALAAQPDPLKADTTAFDTARDKLDGFC